MYGWTSGPIRSHEACPRRFVDVRGENGFEASDATIAMLLRREQEIRFHDGNWWVLAAILEEGHVEIP